MHDSAYETLDAGEPRDPREAEEKALQAPDPTEEMRGRLFAGLDRLAVALELEAAAAIATGDCGAALRLEDQRLGVRLSQRYVAGVYADEVDARIDRSRSDYDRRTRTGGGV